ncbi:hypothetical protein B0T16DRAFT_407314 [Cercophora newfieldiana]|uniref:Heterokaryon incompatibility domain-containing protein n=1 Tax=Cercophora newfieldiana TaxID=92897 RepID=A0AA39YK51_9PEZI|nr:hypothetical protein B0T16DRAFT_407314 [Cercophora newfieldiana]
MDHIQLPSGGLKAIDVPYVAYPAFDSQDFETFPTRVGFPPIDDRAGWLELDSDNTAAIVQSWLYFGLIAAFFNQKIDIGDFIIDSDAPRRLVTSAALLPLLDDWSASARLSEPSEQDRLEALLKLATTALEGFSLLPQSGLPPLPEILLSVHLLITTLGAATSGGSRRAIADTASRPSTNTIDVGPVSQLLASHLLSAGWCPWKVQQILSAYSYLTIYYVSRLRDPTALHITHSKCTEERCIGNNVDMANYSTRHTELSCACLHAPIPEAEMRSIIADGGIPIARIKLSRNGNPYLQVKRAGPRTRYIAVSHVWSDGLGNPHANSLPQCQLKQLSRCLKLLAPPMFDFAQGYMAVPQLNLGIDARRMMVVWGSTEWFWLDTLCIPVGSDDQSVLLKSTAINQMAAIYAGAHQVLVLDSVMQASNVVGRDACHVLAQLSAVAWLGRCWTYQEGALALSLQVQCADCSFDPSLFNDIAVEDSESNEEIYTLLPGTMTTGHSWHRTWRAISLGVKRGMEAINGDLIRDIRGLPELRKEPKTQTLLGGHIYREITEVVGREMRYDRRDGDSWFPSEKMVEEFVLCWNSLAQRTTTMAGDIHVIIANLLRLNAFSILNMKSQEDRMRAILWSLPGIPLSIIFNRSKERARPAEQHANRWMPLWPDRYMLTESPVMRIQDGVLTLATTDIQEDQTPKLLLLDRPLEESEGSAEVLVSDTSGPQVEWYRVLLHRQPGDQFDSQRSHSTVFALEPPAGRSIPVGSAPIAAACLRVNALFHKHPSDAALPDSCQWDMSASEHQLHTTYDCPATIHPLNSTPKYAHLAQYTATSPENYTLAIEHDVPPTLRPLPQRPANPSFTLISGLLMCLCFPFNYLLCAMNAMVIYQNVMQRDTFPTSVLVTSILTITTHAYTFLGVMYVVPPVALIPAVISWLSWNMIPFIIGLVYVVLKAGLGDIGAVDKAVIGLLVAGHVPQIVMVSIVRWYVNPRVYRAWLDTYAPDWEPGKTNWILKAAVAPLHWMGKK